MVVLVGLGRLSRVIPIIFGMVVPMDVLVASKIYIFMRMVHLSEVTLVGNCLLLSICIAHTFTIKGVIQHRSALMLVKLIIKVMKRSIINRLLLQMQIGLTVCVASESSD
jgi:hypothetical protein